MEPKRARRTREEWAVETKCRLNHLAEAVHRLAESIDPVAGIRPPSPDEMALIRSAWMESVEDLTEELVWLVSRGKTHRADGILEEIMEICEFLAGPDKI